MLAPPFLACRRAAKERGRKGTREGAVQGERQGEERCLPESGINFITCLFMGSCPNWVNIDNAQTQQPAKKGREKLQEKEAAEE